MVKAVAFFTYVLENLEKYLLWSTVRGKKNKNMFYSRLHSVTPTGTADRKCSTGGNHKGHLRQAMLIMGQLLEGTHRMDEPVSNTTRNDWGGVPRPQSRERQSPQAHSVFVEELWLPVIISMLKIRFYYLKKWKQTLPNSYENSGLNLQKVYTLNKILKTNWFQAVSGTPPLLWNIIPV